jgi:hypothetical protein
MKKKCIDSQDHLTKFCILRPLSSKRAVEVAYQLVDIFLLIGAPQIFQSDNGSEFTASVITELKELWTDLLMVHGKPRHPQSQGSVERLNCDVKDMLISWMGDNNSTDWPVGLKFVQFMKNTSQHSGIKQTPYSALFGGNPRVGLRSTTLPTEILERLVTEDDFFAAFQPGPSQADDVAPAPSTPAAEANDIAPVDSESAPVPSTSNDSAPELSSIESSRKRARSRLIQQAQRMVKRSRLQHAPGNPGDNVTVPIPLVDRGRGDPRNIMGVILDRDNNDLYRIAVRGGILKGKYARNQFDLCTQILLSRDDVSDVSEIGLRRAVQVESNCGGQGFVKCNCSGPNRCATNRCKCFKAKVKCNSRDTILPLHAKIRLKHSSTTHVELTELFLIFVIFNI